MVSESDRKTAEERMKKLSETIYGYVIDAKL
jgi:hypothetical protein